jgi:hypothetical protein
VQPSLPDLMTNILEHILCSTYARADHMFRSTCLSQRIGVYMSYWEPIGNMQIANRRMHLAPCQCDVARDSNHNNTHSSSCRSFGRQNRTLMIKLGANDPFKSIAAGLVETSGFLSELISHLKMLTMETGDRK